MGKKAYMGPMQDPNGINAQILPMWVPYIHVCWYSAQSAVRYFSALRDQEYIRYHISGVDTLSGGRSATFFRGD